MRHFANACRWTMTGQSPVPQLKPLISRRPIAPVRRSRLCSTFYGPLRSVSQATDSDTEAELAEAHRRLSNAMETATHIATGAKNSFNVFYNVNRVILHDLLLSFVPLFVGEAIFERHSGVIAEWLGIDEFPPRKLGFITARQAGKSTMLAIVAAVVIVHAHPTCHEKFMSVYGQKQDTAKQILRNITAVVALAPERFQGRWERTALTDKSYVTRDFLLASPSQRKCFVIEARAGNPKGARGDDSSVCIYDEFCFMDDNLYTVSVSVHEKIHKRYVVLTSTLDDPVNPLTCEVMRRADAKWKDPTKKVVNLCIVCPRHMSENTPLECNCRRINIPPWKQRGDLYHQIATDEVNPDGAMREGLGMPVTRASCLFDEQKLAPLFDPRVPPAQLTSRDQIAPIECNLLDSLGNPCATQQYRAIFVAVDPATAQGTSWLAVTTAVLLVDGTLDILGMETVDTTGISTAEQKYVVREHIRAISKRFSCLSALNFAGALDAAVIVPLVECNNNSCHTNDIVEALIAQDSFEVVTLFHNVHKNRYDQHAPGGVWTTREVKIEGAALLLRRLSVASIRFDANCVSTGILSFVGNRFDVATGRLRAPTPNRCSTDNAFGRVRDLLQDELMRIVHDPKDGITGKRSGRDDQAICLLLLVYFVTLSCRRAYVNATYRPAALLRAH